MLLTEVEMLRWTMVVAVVAGCEGSFECGGKALQNVPGSAECDGVVDCWGGQDERQDGCATELFFCDDPEPQAILAGQACDGTDDCGSAVDEASCG